MMRRPPAPPAGSLLHGGPPPMPSTRLTRPRAALPALPAILAAFLVAACGGGGGEAPGVATLKTAAPPAPSASVAPAGGEDASKQAFLDYARCMRENGIDFPDPRFDAEGRFMVAANAAALVGLDLGSDEYRSANRACQGTLEGLAISSTPAEQAELRDALVEFAGCMRENGIEMPDPKIAPDGNPVIFGPDGMVESIDIDGTVFRTAMGACRDALLSIPVPGMMGGAGS